MYPNRCHNYWQMLYARLNYFVILTWLIIVWSSQLSNMLVENEKLSTLDVTEWLCICRQLRKREAIAKSKLSVAYTLPHRTKTSFWRWLHSRHNISQRERRRRTACHDCRRIQLYEHHVVPNVVSRGRKFCSRVPTLRLQYLAQLQQASQRTLPPHTAVLDTRSVCPYLIGCIVQALVPTVVMVKMHQQRLREKEAYGLVPPFMFTTFQIPSLSSGLTWSI